MGIAKCYLTPITAGGPHACNLASPELPLIVCNYQGSNSMASVGLNRMRHSYFCLWIKTIIENKWCMFTFNLFLISFVLIRTLYLEKHLTEWYLEEMTWTQYCVGMLFNVMFQYGFMLGQSDVFKQKIKYLKCKERRKFSSLHDAKN